MKLARLFRTGAFVLVAACAGTALWHPPAAHAAAPLAKEQAPGFYRLMVGDFQVTALSDGTVALPVDQLLTRTTPAQVKKILARSHLESPLETSVNGYLINTGSKLVLVDTGAAALFGPTLGKLVANLKAAGYQPEQVDEVYITHLHPDHVGGLLAGDKPAFPNATVRADRHDADYWLSQSTMDQAPADAKDFFKGAMASLNPYIAAGKFKPFDGDTELVPGIRAQAARGHTAGHSIFIAREQGPEDRLLGRPDARGGRAVREPFGHDPVRHRLQGRGQGAAQGLRRRGTSQGYLVAGAHLAFPGIGRLRAQGGGATSGCR